MQIVQQQVSTKHNLYWCSDIHFGTITHNKKGFKEFLERAWNDKHGYIIIGGDLVEGRPKSHKFIDLDTADFDMLLPINQYEAFFETIRPYASKILVILEGNHDRAFAKECGNVIEFKCKELEIPYGTIACKINLIDNKKKPLYKIYAHHGFGSIRSSAGDIIRRDGFVKEALKRKLKEKAGDALLMGMGHTHKLIVCEPTPRLHMFDDGTKLVQEYSRRHGNSRFILADDRWYINTGSFMKSSVMGVSTYSEAAGYDPIEMGYILVHGNGNNIESIEKVVI